MMSLIVPVGPIHSIFRSFAAIHRGMDVTLSHFLLGAIAKAHAVVTSLVHWLCCTA